MRTINVKSSYVVLSRLFDDSERRGRVYVVSWGFGPTVPNSPLMVGGINEWSVTLSNYIPLSANALPFV